jgi:hypothetical protein
MVTGSCSTVRTQAKIAAALTMKRIFAVDTRVSRTVEIKLFQDTSW